MVSEKGPFEEREGIILDELSLGISWERPSLILAVYRSELIKKAVQTDLIKSLEQSRQECFEYLVDQTHYDIPVELRDHSNHKSAAYFVSGLRWGGGRGYSNAFRALNMHREYLVDGNIKAIFWLTQSEATQCPRYAPDFWAFRHKVVEFLELPSPKNHLMPKLSPASFRKTYTGKGMDFQKEISAAERLYASGCIDEAIQTYRGALRRYPDLTSINLIIADIHLSMGRVNAAKRILSKADKRKIGSKNFLEELRRLQKAAKSVPPIQGGISKQSN